MKQIELDYAHEIEQKKLQLEKEAWRVRCDILRSRQGTNSEAGADGFVPISEWSQRLNKVADTARRAFGADVNRAAIQPPLINVVSSRFTESVPPTGQTTTYILPTTSAMCVPPISEEAARQTSSVWNFPPVNGSSTPVTSSGTMMTISNSGFTPLVPPTSGFIGQHNINPPLVQSVSQPSQVTNCINYPILAQGLGMSNVYANSVKQSCPITSSIAGSVVGHNVHANNINQRFQITSSIAGSIVGPSIHANNINSLGNMNLQSNTLYTSSSYLPSTFAQSETRSGQIHNSQPVPTAINNSDTSVPSPRQLAARHVMPKDLPVFSGNSEEWPMFYSAFYTSTEACGYSEVENLGRLQRCLKGSALEAVRGRLLLPSAVPQVMQTLQFLYGRPEQIIYALLAKVRDLPAPKADNLKALMTFGMSVQNFCDHLVAADQVAHLTNPALLQELIDKLPANLKLDWAVFKRRYTTVDLRVFGEYMANLVSAAADVTLTIDPGTSKSARGEKTKSFVNAHATEALGAETVNTKPQQLKQKEQSIRCFVCSNVDHRVKECNVFKKFSETEKWKTVNEHQLCRICLGKHGRKPCRVQTRCEIQGCKMRHHPLLHSSAPTTTFAKQVLGYGQSEGVNTHRHGQSATLFRVLPVTLHSKEKSVETFAFIDDGSSVTLIDKKLADALNIEGVKKQLCLSWTGNITRDEDDSHQITVEVSAIGGSSKYKLEDVRTVNSLALPKQSLRYKELAQRYKYLRNLPISDFESAVPGILIGAGHAHLTTTLQLREGQDGEPVAIKTRLGWTIHGPVSGEKQNYSYNLHICECTEAEDIKLHELVKQHFSIESVGVSVDRGPESEEEKRAKAILKQTTKRVGNSFETGLIWRFDYVEFPDSYPMAVRRMQCFERRLKANPTVNESVRKQILEYQQKQYIHEVTEEEMKAADPRRVWYLPLNIVTSAWREDPKQNPKVYSMDVATFGSTSSPCSAQYIKNINAQEFSHEFPKAAEAIQHRHYVDDYLDSFDTEEEACRIAREVKMIHKRGGFTIHNWLSNSPEVLRRVGAPDGCREKVVGADKSKSIERVLGMLWMSEADVFVYANEVNLTEFPATKRGILKCVMSQYDPLGLLSHFLIHGRVIIQDIWRTKADWDDIVGDEILTRWRVWTRLFDALKEVRIPRPYFPGVQSSDISELQLHMFVDASESAYACVAYFRAKIHGEYRSALVSAKAKVAPLKSLSIPRLELQAALLGTRLMKTLCASHSFPITRRIFWTDSKTVLSWLYSDHRRYRQFVACRIGEILSKSNVEEWWWIPTKLNVADDATKWGKGPNLNSDSRWFTGPQFLKAPEETWPRQPAATETPEELRPCLVQYTIKNAQDSFIQWDRFSKYERLWRTIGYVCRVAENFRSNKPNYEHLTKDELNKAENVIWRAVQAQAFPEETVLLKRIAEDVPTVKLEKTSKLYKLSPFKDDNGVIRMESRLTAACFIPFDTQFPIILPKDHALTILLINWYHRSFLHANNETVVNELRQRFYIPSLRSLVRKVGRSCTLCKVKKAKPAVPRMAPFPKARLSPFVRPFSYVGLDYFGPIQVKIGRSLVKRWCALFTCLTVRAVHLEIVHSLSTNSCKMAIRRFLVRRGSPLEIWSDNGTNFLGASRELKQQLNETNRQLSAVFTNATTKWIFIPPSAPHMGGSWERLVRSVKTAFAGLSTTRNPDEETLVTLLIEAEGVVNSRPLMFIPLESEAQESLTPNHFLLLSSQGVSQQPQPIVDRTESMRTNWNLMRSLVDEFWHRWIKQYLPTIAGRTKWTNEAEQLKEGELVVVVDEATRNGWLRGRVLSVVKGDDGRVRQAYVKTQNGVLRRPVTKVAVLEVQRDDLGKADQTSAFNQHYGSGDVGTPNDICPMK